MLNALMSLLVANGLNVISILFLIFTHIYTWIVCYIHTHDDVDMIDL